MEIIPAVFKSESFTPSEESPNARTIIELAVCPWKFQSPVIFFSGYNSQAASLIWNSATNIIYSAAHLNMSSIITKCLLEKKTF